MAHLLGFSLYGLKELDIVSALRLCREIGYHGVELCLTPGWPAEPSKLNPASRKAIKAELQHQHLALPSFMEQLSLLVNDTEHAQNLMRIAAAAELAHDLAPGSPPLIETVLGGKPAEWDRVRDRMLARLRDWESAARRAKIVISIKAHVGGAVNQPSRVEWLLDRIDSPWIRTVYDFSHFQLIGLDLETTMREMMPRTNFVHVKDSKGTEAKYQFLLPGDGTINYTEYFALLHKYHYKGYIVPEVSLQLQRLPGYDGPAAARKSYAALHLLNK